MMTANCRKLNQRVRICILVASLFVGLTVWPLPVSAVGDGALANQCDPVLLFASGNACFTARHVRAAESRMTVVPVTPSRFVYRWSGLTLKQMIITLGFSGSNPRANGINYVYGSVPIFEGAVSSPTPQKPGFLIVTEIVGQTASRGSHAYRQQGASHFDGNFATRNLSLLMVSNLPLAIVRRIAWAILR